MLVWMYLVENKCILDQEMRSCDLTRYSRTDRLRCWQITVCIYLNSLIAAVLLYFTFITLSSIVLLSER